MKPFVTRRLAGPLAVVLALALAPAGYDALAAVEGGTAISEAQLVAGASAYRQACAACHGADLEGGNAPALASADILSGYHTVGGLFDLISQSMPPQAPGALKQEDYAAIVAFILARNGACTGERALAPAEDRDSALKLIELAKGCPRGTQTTSIGTAQAADSRAVPQAYTWGQKLPSVSDPE